MYDWRRMTAEDRAHALDVRRARQLPWHSPPHLDLEGTHPYLISAACYEHAQIIGKSLDRMTECEEALLQVCRDACLTIHAWCVLPNHYHVLVITEQIKELRRGLGQFMADRRIPGTVRTRPGAAKSGTTASSDR